MRYNDTWQRFAAQYGEENCKVLFYEDLRLDQAAFFREVTEFLRIDNYAPRSEIHSNRSVGQRTDGFFLEQLRKSGMDEPLRRFAPEGLRRQARRLLKREIRHVEISEATRKAFLRMVAPEARAILDRAGRSYDLWTLE
jgi:hypothetical protein